MNKKFLSIFLLSITTLCYAQNNDYGVNQANTKFFPKEGVLGGRVDFNYLSLENHNDVSGVPLGGIGVGNVNFSPKGRFTRIGINNIHTPIKRTEACFFALWSNVGGETQSVRLVNDDQKQYSLVGVDNVQYTGLFPTSTMKFANSNLNVTPVIRAYSSLVPHNLKDSSLPVVWFEVDLTAEYDGEVSIALSWEDFIGMYVDPKELGKIDNGQLLSGGRSELVNGEQWPMKPKIATTVAPYNTKQYSGIVHRAAEPINPVKLTFQNYVDRVVICIDNEKDQKVTVFPSYDVLNGTEAWAEFATNGEFNGHESGQLTAKNARPNASIIAVKTKLKAGKTKTVRFTMSWWAPEIELDPNAPVGTYWTHGADYNKYYHNYFSNIDEILSYAKNNRKRLYDETVSWHKPIMNSSMPDWYKFKLINSGYVTYTNVILNKKGDMTVNEGAMGGFAGTMDQRLSSHPFYQKFFTQMDRSEMEIFADAADAEKGYILHFIGHYYAGLGTVGGKTPTEKGWMLDNSSGWLIQLVKDYEQTGDIKYLRKWASTAKRVMEFLYSMMPEGSTIPVGPTTYDDFSHPPLYSYYAGVWLTTLRAYEAMGEALGDKTIVDKCRAQFAVSQKEAIDKLWNGRFFAYGCEPDGSKRLDCVLFTGQLAGQFLSRYCGWGDIYPMDIVKASLVSQFKISIANTPDYYANKVWDINLGRGIDNRGSQCWPFYLESYTAYSGIQAGFVKDGLDIMKHIQLVHLRNGWEWTQNLWNPSDITYMTSPVTWFSTDVLAGAGVNIPKKELRLSPIVTGKERVVLPLFYPTFWATVTADPATKRLTVKVIKTFSDKKESFTKVISQPIGLPTSEGAVIDIPNFVIEKGRILDLSRYWDTIIAPSPEIPVLGEADKFPFRYVDKNTL